MEATTDKVVLLVVLVLAAVLAAVLGVLGVGVVSPPATFAAGHTSLRRRAGRSVAGVIPGTTTVHAAHQI